jgi:hypothetical protein
MTLFIFILLGSGRFDPDEEEATDSKRAVLFDDRDTSW